MIMNWKISPALAAIFVIADLVGGQAYAAASKMQAHASVFAAADAPAITVARAHIAAWSRHDYAAARRLLASNVHVTAVAPDSGMGRVDTTGVDRYMEGLTRFADAIRPGSARIVGASGDAQHAMVLVTAKAALGPGPLKTITAARLYHVDAKGLIDDEEVTFYVTR
jgi:hypothetical protein